MEGKINTLRRTMRSTCVKQNKEALFVSHFETDTRLAKAYEIKRYLVYYYILPVWDV